MDETKVIRSDPDSLLALEAAGWIVIARSWGAALRVRDSDRERLEALVDHATTSTAIREIAVDDIPRVLELDAETVDDYPGGLVTQHTPLSLETATPTTQRRGWGAFSGEKELIAMTYVDQEDEHLETDFTVVRKQWRGNGYGAAVKAASILKLFAEGFTVFRTGGSSDNAASMGANRSVGYVVDEEWVTLLRPKNPGSVTEHQLP